MSIHLHAQFAHDGITNAREHTHPHKHVSIQLIIYTQALSVRIVRIKWLLHVYDTMGTAMSIVHM